MHSYGAQAHTDTKAHTHTHTHTHTNTQFQVHALSCSSKVQSSIFQNVLMPGTSLVRLSCKVSTLPMHTWNLLLPDAGIGGQAAGVVKARPEYQLVILGRTNQAFSKQLQQIRISQHRMYQAHLVNQLWGWVGWQSWHKALPRYGST